MSKTVSPLKRVRLQGGGRGCRVAAGKALRADGAGRVELGAA